MQSPPDETESAPIEPREAIPYASNGTQFATLAEVTAVVIRICAVTTFFQFVGYLGYAVSLIPQKPTFQELVNHFFTPVGQMVLGILLWCFADPLSHIFAPPRMLPVVPADRIGRVERLVFAAVGMFVLLDTIPQLISWIARRLGAEDSSLPVYLMNGDWVIAGHIVQVFGALWMIAGNERIRSFWRRLRSPDFR